MVCMVCLGYTGDALSFYKRLTAAQLSGCETFVTHKWNEII